MTWTWRYEDPSGATVVPLDTVPTAAAFATQADAESWIGENWRQLLAGGVAQVSLFEGDRKVYGPMGLTSPE